MKKKEYFIVGVMSGTSLDGIDLSLVHFTKNQNSWKHKILSAKTYPYSSKWIKSLKSATQLSAYEFIALHRAYGQFIGQVVNKFLSGNTIDIDYIASHGHTTFHEPQNNISFQIGDGAAIAATCRIPTISDFRTLDICLGGQGAPLVPIGDQLLFSDYTACINLGGFSNISYQQEDKRIAFDICPVNFVLNRLVEPLGLEYDHDGNLGRKGVINQALLSSLNKLAFYKVKPPKSLGQEWVEENIIPILPKDEKVENTLRTFYEHISIQITNITNEINGTELLFSGGGAKNSFLMSLINSRSSRKEIVIPNKTLIDYKEALIFAFLGLLRAEEEINTLASVTGANKDSCGGVIHYI